MYVVDNGTFMYAEHAKLVDADASAPKPVQNTLNHVKRSFKVTHSGITEKPTRDCILLYNNVGLRSEISKEKSEHTRFR